MLTLVSKTFFALALLVFCLLQYSLWLGDKNVSDLLQQRNEIRALEAENVRLLARNDRLLAEVLNLKEGGPAIETLARYELGYIKEGETFFQVIER